MTTPATLSPGPSPTSGSGEYIDALSPGTGGEGGERGHVQARNRMRLASAIASSVAATASQPTRS